MSSPDVSGYLRLVPYNDHDDATLTPSSAAATGFPPEDTQNNIRSRVWRTTSAAGQSLTGVLSATRTANHFSMFRHRAHGASVQLQLYSDAGASSQVYSSGALPLDNVTASDPYTWGSGTNDPFLQDAPYYLWFNDTNYRSYKITWSGTPSVYSSYFQVSRIWLGKYLELTRQPGFGLSLGMADVTDKNRSLGGSLRTNVGESWRTMSMDLVRVEDYERATWLKIMRQLGTGRDFVLSLYPGDGTELERDYTLNCKFTSLDPIVRDVARYTKRVQIEET